MSGRLKSQTRITWDHQHRWQCRNANASTGFLLRSTIVSREFQRNVENEKKKAIFFLQLTEKKHPNFRITDRIAFFLAFFHVCAILNFIWNVFKKNNRGYNSIRVFWTRFERTIVSKSWLIHYVWVDIGRFISNIHSRIQDKPTANSLLRIAVTTLPHLRNVPIHSDTDSLSS